MNSGAAIMRFFLAVILILTSAGAAWANGLDDGRAGLAAVRRGEYDEAIRLFSAAIASGELSPRNIVVAYLNRGNAYQDKGDYEHAVVEYNTVIQVRPDYAEAYYSRGRARFALGEFMPAATDFARSVTLAPSDAYSVLWLHLARRQTEADELSLNSASLDLASWPGTVVKLYLGTATPEQTFAASTQGDAAIQTERTCEATFYIGEYELLRKNTGAAKMLFQNAVSDCPFGTDESGGAVAELKRLQ
jgi:lipoprotein NlpI